MANFLSEDIIREILDIRRVPRRMRVSAQARLGRMDLVELQSRLSDLKEQRVKIDIWGAELENRSAQNIAGTCEDILIPPTIETVPSLWEVLDSREDESEVGQHSILSEALAKGKKRTLGDGGEVLSSEILNKNCKSALKAIIRRIGKSSIKIQSSSHPVAPQLSMEEAVIGIGRIENEIAFHRPDVIIGLNAQGLSVARLIMCSLKLDAKILEIKGAANTYIENLSAFSQMKDCTVCVVGHVLHSGKTMRAVIEEAKTRFQTRKVYGAALAASENALNGSLKDDGIVFHQRATGNNVAITIGQSSNNIDQNEYLFQTEREGLFSVDPEILELFREFGSKKFAIEKLAWEKSPD